jgi:hypothetical protein
MPPPTPSAAAEPAGETRFAWGVLLALVALAAVAVVPTMTAAWSLRPFQPQTAAVLARAYAARRAAPWMSGTALAAALALTLRAWRVPRRSSALQSANRPPRRLGWAGRTTAVLLVAVIAAAAWVSRQEYFEWMFAPLHEVRHVSAAAADFVRPGAAVLAVEVGGDAVAYPVRQLAYHHVVEDVAGGVPIVVTY